MRADVVVEPAAEFRKWVAGLKQKVPEPFMESVVEDTEANPIPVGAGGA
jgi:heme/copper-type cytochrome/quinol oxidase subunit 2